MMSGLPTDSDIRMCSMKIVSCSSESAPRSLSSPVSPMNRTFSAAAAVCTLSISLFHSALMCQGCSPTEQYGSELHASPGIRFLMLNACCEWSVRCVCMSIFMVRGRIRGLPMGDNGVCAVWRDRGRGRDRASLWPRRRIVNTSG